jgi:hypothetical protein
MLEERVLPKGTIVRFTGMAITLLTDTLVAAESIDWQELERLHGLPPTVKPPVVGKLRITARG